MESDRTARRDGWLLLTLAIVFSIACFVLTDFRYTNTDTENYIYAAEALLDNQEYPRVSVYNTINHLGVNYWLPFFRAPGYPLVIAGLWAIFGKSYTVLLLANAVFHGFTVKCIYDFSRIVFRSRQIAVATGLAVALNPFLLFGFVRSVSTECLQVLLVAIFVKNLFQVAVSPRLAYKNAIFAGLCAGYGSLNRTSMLHISFALTILFLAYAGYARSCLRAMSVQAAIVLTAAALVIAPWTISNVVSGRGPFLINDPAGWSLWTGYHPGLMKIYEPIPENTKFYDYFYECVLRPYFDQVEIWRKTESWDTLTAADRQKLWKASAYEIISEDPYRSLKLTFFRFFDYWRPWLNPKAYGKVLYLSSFAIILPYFTLGLLTLFRFDWKQPGDNERPPLATLFRVEVLLLFMLSTVPHLFTYSMLRYRIPFIDPYLMMLTCFGAFRLYGRFVSRSAASVSEIPPIR